MSIEEYKKYEPIDGKWYLKKELGSGSFGTVFEIQRKDYPDMKSALKIITIPNSPNEVRVYREENYDLDEQSVTSYFYSFVEEFVKEFRLMSQLRGNSNIVSYEDHDVKQHENGIGWDIFIRMELLKPLGQYFGQNSPSRRDIIKLGIDICKALETCQKYHIIHRDIKPSNIFVSDTGDFKLGDFGVARTLEKTSSGLSKKGTYTYMAPEVFKGESYGPNVDIYSLGIVMYKLLNDNMEPFRTDRTYSDGERAMELRMQGKPVPKPAHADEALARIILKACSYSPQDRYPDPAQMRRELEELYSGKEATQTGTEKVKSENGFEFSQDNTSATISVFSGSENDSKSYDRIAEPEKPKTACLSEQEISEIASKRPPLNGNTDAAKLIFSQALAKILPIYDSASSVTRVLSMNNRNDIEKMIAQTDTESLLTIFKALSFYLSHGENAQVVNPVQSMVVEELKNRGDDLAKYISAASGEGKGQGKKENSGEKMKYCTKCGAAARKEQQFCIKCGQPFHVQTSPVSNESRKNYNLFTAYASFFKNYANFKGRSRRSEYWYVVLMNLLLLMARSILERIIVTICIAIYERTGAASIFSLLNILDIPLILYCLAILVPSLALGVRRLHDAGKSGWYLLTALIPIAGLILLIVFMATDSQPGKNQYGANPKGL